MVMRFFVCHAAAGDSLVGLIHGESIWGDRATDDAFSQAPTGVDHDFIAIAGDRIGTEYHSRSIGGHQLLHQNGDL